jgi:hypothetical protein
VISHFDDTRPVRAARYRGREGATGTISTFGPPRERGGPAG